MAEWQYVLPVWNFNSRPSARGDARCALLRWWGRNDFNSRPSARGDCSRATGKPDVLLISIHAPPRGATRMVCRRTVTVVFQFTPLREGRPVQSYQYTDAAKISIHAPPRGATFLLCCTRGRHFISIHAPPRGATRRRSSWKSSGNFNSRPSARGDRSASPFASLPPISIHAPPRGATNVAAFSVVKLFYFNSRPSARGDRWASSRPSAWTAFQFTPLREGRLFKTKNRAMVEISIHAPPRGATQWRCNVASGIRISIHAPPRGATRGRLFGGEAVLFQFTPLREGRRGRAGNRAQRGRISIHAPPRGAT